MTKSIISVKNFSKSFREREVVSDLSLDVQKGEGLPSNCLKLDLWK
jgi:ABC-type lipopolysaccharide export system ATPase subunit